MPSKVTFTDGSTITYSYAADGTKLRTVHTVSGTTTTKDYCANVVYENGIQKMLLTEEGYVDLSASTPTYYYYLKDHQGNNRVVINGSGTVVETNHYYPFGGVFASTGNVQPYKYNGKELDTKKGLDWYDYGARHYDATLGRWFVADPLAEKYYSTSAYGYCLNNPIKFVDSNGMAASPIYDRDGNLLGTDDEGLQGDAIVMNKMEFKQGMSHEEALSKSTTISSVDAAAKMAVSYASLKFRPDYDGFVTVDEGVAWAKRHPNALENPTPLNSLYINAGLLDFGELSVNDIGIRNIGKFSRANLYTMKNTFGAIFNERLRASVYALGRVNIILHNPVTGSVSIVNNDATYYDWNQGGGLIRNWAIQLERWRTGLNDSHGFKVHYYGRGFLNK